MRIVLYIFGFAVFYSFWRLLKRDWSFGFGWWEMGFTATYGIQTKKGGDPNCSSSSTGLNLFWSFPWNKTRRWEKWFAPDGSMAYFSKSYNWYQCRWRKMFGRKANPLFDYDYNKREYIERSIEQEFPFEYTTQDGTVQKMRIFCYFGEDFRGWIALPFIGEIHRYCHFRVTEELGEKAGSWKGGVIASAVERKPWHSMDDCLETIRNRKW